MMLFSKLTKRPRNVDSSQAAAVLYGDWGTSKAYVVGLAFALAGYASFWLIAAVSVLNILVALNYIWICKFFPNGGGVYASVRDRSEVLALVGAFFLIGDYLITAALSAVSAFQYLGIAYPAHWAGFSILVIGMLNYFGPKHSGNMAFYLSLPTVAVVFILGFISIPYLKPAIHALPPLQESWGSAWQQFVVVIVALSGIESIANMTGVMKLNPGTTQANPSVTKTSTPAIIMVMLEVSFFTALFGLIVNAIPGLTLANGNVDAPGHPAIRDAMLRFLGETLGGQLFGVEFGYILGYAVSVTFCVLLLSAVNTAIVALVSLLYVMSKNGDLPVPFQKLNRFGVPFPPLALATGIPLFFALYIGDVARLADLYAIGFVGAIATNLGSTATDPKRPMNIWGRVFMFGTFLIMAAIEITLFATKPHARNFVLGILAIGLLLRSLVIESKQKQVLARQQKIKPEEAYPHLEPKPGEILCAVSKKGKTLDFALLECQKYKLPLHLLFIREQQVITQDDLTRVWSEDPEASEVFDYAKHYLNEVQIRFNYVVSDAPAHTIVETAQKLNISRIIIGMARRNPLYQVLRGNLVKKVSQILPANIDLVVIS